MWAGGRLSFLAPVRIGARVRKTSRVLAVDHKAGRAGDLVFVTVLHELAAMSGELLVREEHDIVYKNASPPSTSPGSAEPLPADARCRPFAPTSTMLFRYSALTFNGHRIHYDRRYVTTVEGYPGLVVHGPLIATLLLDLVRRHAPSAAVSAFEFRAIRPTFDLNPFSVCGAPTEDGCSIRLWAKDHEGYLTMSATAHLKAD